MIEGIEILAQTEIMQTPAWAGIILTVSFIAVLVGFFLLVIGVSYQEDSLTTVGIITLVIFLITGLIISNIEEPSGKYEYKVILNTTVPFTEMYENYEVIEQDGRIFTIREKE